MSNKNREYEVWEQEHGYYNRWKLIATFPTRDEAKELIGHLDSEKDSDCHPLENPDFMYRIVRAKKRLKGLPPKS